MSVEEIINSGQGTIVDVRTPMEFMGGAVADSKNIPLDQVMSRMEELKSLAQPLVLVCASGNRSGMAQQYLSKQGFECHNGGSWLNVNYLVAQKA